MVKKSTLETVKDAIQGVAEVASVPGSGLVVLGAQQVFDAILRKRFDAFLRNANVDQHMLDTIASDETHSTHLYAALETVRQTHSKLGLIALALMYRDHWAKVSTSCRHCERFRKSATVP
jgi:hypothetical protein